jgi:hypothetical protein
MVVVVDSPKRCHGISLGNIDNDGPLHPRLLSDHALLTSSYFDFAIMAYS